MYIQVILVAGLSFENGKNEAETTAVLQSLLPADSCDLIVKLRLDRSDSMIGERRLAFAEKTGGKRMKGAGYMKSNVITKANWSAFAPSFARSLPLIGVSKLDEKGLMKKAKLQYRRIIGTIPAFGENDVLFVNIASAALLASVYLSLPEKPSAAQMKAYYESAMNGNSLTRLFMKSNSFFTEKYQNRLKKSAEKSQRATNPYTWRFAYIPGATLDSFDAIFEKCGIYNLMKDLGIPELTPAMCAYDYAMAELKNTVFTREYTLASGGTVCDCHYRRKDS